MCKKILEEKNINFELREYLKDPMTKEEIKIFWVILMMIYKNYP